MHVSTTKLPLDLVITVNNGVGTTNGALTAELGVAGSALESFLLALACEGINLNNPRILSALQTAIDAITNHEEA